MGPRLAARAKLSFASAAIDWFVFVANTLGIVAHWTSLSVISLGVGGGFLRRSGRVSWCFARIRSRLRQSALHQSAPPE
jgi:hypothetical protein